MSFVYGKKELDNILHYKFKQSLEKILLLYGSPQKMLKGNLQILKDLNYNQYPEIQIAFCQGAVFSEIVNLLNVEYSFKEIPEKALQEAQQLFLAFCRGEYDI